MKAGRPPKPIAERLTVTLCLRLTDSEGDRLCRAALRRGESINAYVRGLLRELLQSNNTRSAA